MTQSLPSKHVREQQPVTVVDPNKSFLDLSTAEIEQLAVTATTKARKQMHQNGLSTIISLDENVYEEHPDGGLTLIHERPAE